MSLVLSSRAGTKPAQQQALLPGHVRVNAHHTVPVAEIARYVSDPLWSCILTAPKLIENVTYWHRLQLRLQDATLLDDPRRPAAQDRCVAYGRKAKSLAYQVIAREHTAHSAWTLLEPAQRAEHELHDLWEVTPETDALTGQIWHHSAFGNLPDGFVLADLIGWLYAPGWTDPGQAGIRAYLARGLLRGERQWEHAEATEARKSAAIASVLQRKEWT